MDGAGENLTIGTTFFPEFERHHQGLRRNSPSRTKACRPGPHEPNQMDAAVYDIVYLYAEAMKRANVSGDAGKLAAERTAVRDELAKMKNYDALEGKISFVDGDAVKPVYVLEVKSGKWSLLDTRMPE